MKPQVIAGIDPRSFRPSRIEPPSPLPHVSRKAIARVKHYIVPFTQCHLCQGDVELVKNSEVYDGRTFGQWPFVYLCRGCGAYVGLHPHTDLPLGYLATASDRDERRKAKLPFATLVRAHFNDDRYRAYSWLAGELAIEPKYCHFSMFDEDMCIKVFEICIEKVFDLR